MLYRFSPFISQSKNCQLCLIRTAGEALAAGSKKTVVNYTPECVFFKSSTPSFSAFFPTLQACRDVNKLSRQGKCFLQVG